MALPSPQLFVRFNLIGGGASIDFSHHSVSVCRNRRVVAKILSDAVMKQLTVDQCESLYDDSNEVMFQVTPEFIQSEANTSKVRLYLNFSLKDGKELFLQKHFRVEHFETFAMERIWNRLSSHPEAFFTFVLDKLCQESSNSITSSKVITFREMVQDCIDMTLLNTKESSTFTFQSAVKVFTDCEVHLRSKDPPFPEQGYDSILYPILETYFHCCVYYDNDGGKKYTIDFGKECTNKPYVSMIAKIIETTSDVTRTTGNEEDYVMTESERSDPRAKKSAAVIMFYTQRYNPNRIDDD